MIEKASVTILANNFVDESAYWAEHGLCLLLSYVENGEGKKILVDTGQSGEIALHNVDVAGISLDDLTAIVISHGHYDHIGGLLRFLRALPRRVQVVIHPDAWGPRYHTKPSLRSIGFHMTPEDIEREGAEILMGSRPIYLADQIFTTGTIVRTEPVEKNTSFRRIVGQTMVNDEMTDDVSVAIHLGEEGLFLLTGCCHSGIINTLEHVINMTGERRIKGIVGGLHLRGASPERIGRTTDYLRRINPELIAPLHCSGLVETFQLKQALGTSVQVKGAGDQIRIR